MELLNVYAITSDGTKVEASANTVGAVPQGQIATKDKAGLFKIGENKYKFYVTAWNSDKTDSRLLYVWVNNKNNWYDTDRLVWSSSEEIKVEMVSSTDGSGTVTNAVYYIEDYNGNKCIKVTYTWGDTVLTAYVDGSTGESNAKTWVQVNNNGEAYVETKSVDIATNYSAGTVMPNANNFTIDSSTGDLQLNLATDTTRGGIKVEKTDISGAKELTLVQFGSGDGYTCLMVFPKLDVELVQGGLQINSTSYDDTTIDGQYETSDFSCIFLYGGQRKTVSKWWFEDQTIVWEDWEDGTQYKLSNYTITSVQHVKVYRIYRFKAYDSNNSKTYLLDIIAGLDQETCASDQEISDYVCKYDADRPNTDPALSDTYEFYLASDGYYHPTIMQYTRGAQISSFDTTWLCRFGTEMEGILKGSLTDLIEDRAGSTGDYLIKDNTVSSGGYRFYLQDVSNGLSMYSPVYMKNDFHDYAEYAQYAATFGGSATVNRVILNDKEQPIVDIDRLNITQKVQTIIDDYHTPKIASTTQLGHVQAGVNTDGYTVTDLKYTDITGDTDGNVAQYTGTVTDNGNNYEIIVKSKVEHAGITALGYKFTNNDQTVWTSLLSDIGIPTITFVEEDNYYYLRVTITSSATSTIYTLGSNVTENGTKRYVDVDSNGVMSYLIPNVDTPEVNEATETKTGTVKYGVNGYEWDMYGTLFTVNTAPDSVDSNNYSVWNSQPTVTLFKKNDTDTVEVVSETEGWKIKFHTNSADGYLEGLNNTARGYTTYLKNNGHGAGYFNTGDIKSTYGKYGKFGTGTLGARKYTVLVKNKHIYSFYSTSFSYVNGKYYFDGEPYDATLIQPLTSTSVFNPTINLANYGYDAPDGCDEILDITDVYPLQRDIYENSMVRIPIASDKWVGTVRTQDRGLYYFKKSFVTDTTVYVEGYLKYKWTTTKDNILVFDNGKAVEDIVITYKSSDDAPIRALMAWGTTVNQINFVKYNSDDRTNELTLADVIPVDELETQVVDIDSNGVMTVKKAAEATDTTLGTVKYGNNGYKYYAYADDTSTGIVVSKKIVEVTTNILHTSFDATTKEATWLQTKPTFTFHEIPDSGFTITDVSIVQSGTSAIQVFKFSIAYTNSSGTSGTTILQATGNETCTYGMVNKSSVTGQMMTDMTFLPDFIVAEMKKHTESWTFTLEDDSTITHNVVVLDD